MKFRAFDPFPPFGALAALGFTVLCVTASACSTNVTNNPPGSSSGTSGSAPVATADCTSRCEAKGSQCGAPASKAREGCAAICDGSYTSDQLSCLESKPCKELQAASGLSEVCPRSGTGTSGGGSTSGGGTTHFSCSLNGECFKCNDSAGVAKCSITTGPGPGCTKTDSTYCQ